jgi:hypothetical protein
VYQAQGIDPQTVNYDALLLEDAEDAEHDA